MAGFRVASTGLRLAQRDGRHVVETQKGALVIPSAFVSVVEWILARNDFGGDEVASAFPENTREQLDQVLANLTKSGVLLQR